MMDRDVRYYLITNHGRSRLDANTDHGAVLAAKAIKAKYSWTGRVVKETREVIYEVTND